MHEKVFDKFVRGKTCVSCGIWKKDVLSFNLGWSLAEDIEKSDVAEFYFVHHLEGAENENTKDFEVKFKGDTRRRIAVNHDDDELIMVAQGGNVLRHNPNGGKSERKLTRDEIVLSRSIRCIGKHFYVAGGVRRVLRRDGIEQWTDITKQLRSDQPARETLDHGFDDLDGFNEADIYAVGGRGDAWRFDGNEWHQLDLPTNVQLKSVCCASDGNVYIGGNGHTVLRGNRDQWQVLNQAETNSAFMQIINFKDRVYAVDEWGRTLYEVTRDGVTPTDMGDYSLPDTGCLCMATGHGMLLVAGSESASLFDGKVWRDVFRNPDEDELALGQKMLDDSQSALEQLIDDLDDGQ